MRKSRGLDSKLRFLTALTYTMGREQPYLTGPLLFEIDRIFWCSAARFQASVI